MDKQTKKRYAIVNYSKKYDAYCLTDHNWADNHFDSPEEAMSAAELLKPSLESKLNIPANTVHVIQVDCWMNGDCCGTIFTEEYVKKNAVRLYELC